MFRQQPRRFPLRPPPAAPSGNVAGVAIAGNNNQVVNVQDNSVHINVFTQERTDFVDYAAVKKIMDEALPHKADPATAAIHALTQAAMLIYSNPEHPENITCFLPNKKAKDALVHVVRPEGGTTWEVQPVIVTLPPMVQKSLGVLFDHQPMPEFPGCEGMRSHKDFEEIYKELCHNEDRYARGEEIRPVLVRNKSLLKELLRRLPLAGEK